MVKAKEMDLERDEELDLEEQAGFGNEEVEVDAEERKVNAKKPRMDVERDFGRETAELLKKYPEVCGHNLPEKVVMAALEGKSLLQAYEDYKTEQVHGENVRLQKELAALRQNRSAAKKAPVKAVSGETIRDRVEDDFLRGFND